MTLLTGLLSLLTAAATLLPFPSPYTGPISADAKFASGPIISIEPGGKSLVMNTLAGPFKVVVDPTTRVLGTDAKPVALTAAFHPGNYVRVFFVVKDGAHAEELDLLPARMR